MQGDDELSRPIGGVIEDVYITAPVSRGGDGITVYGSDGRCYANHWWIRLQGHQGARMEKREALALMARLESRMVPR